MIGIILIVVLLAMLSVAYLLWAFVTWDMEWPKKHLERLKESMDARMGTLLGIAVFLIAYCFIILIALKGKM